MNINAAVLGEIDGAFTIKSLELETPRSDEVLVRIAGVGLCHTDLGVRAGHLPFELPGVLGHEGSGVVEQVGSAVTKVAVGDKVVLSFRSCGQCAACRRGLLSYCLEFGALNFGGVRADGSSPLNDGENPVGALFFGQSSFASHALANEQNVVKVEAGEDELVLLGPLGCGFQTGAGAVMNSMKCRPGSSLLVFGGGSVGLAAVMAAVVREVDEILIVEPSASRRETALKVGATHVLDPAAGSVPDAVRALVPDGVDYVLDTTGLVPVLTDAVLCTAQKAVLGMVGVGPEFASNIPVSMAHALNTGLTVMGIIEGDSVPDEFIPELVDLYRAGRFPLDALITLVPLADIEDAVHRQHEGEGIKMVLVPGDLPTTDFATAKDQG